MPYLYIFSLVPNGNRKCTLGFGGPFHSLNDEINGAEVGDDLMICSGSYNEQLRISKNLGLSPSGGVVTLGQ